MSARVMSGSEYMDHVDKLLMFALVTSQSPAERGNPDRVAASGLEQP